MGFFFFCFFFFGGLWLWVFFAFLFFLSGPKAELCSTAASAMLRQQLSVKCDVWHREKEQALREREL